MSDERIVNAVELPVDAVVEHGIAMVSYFDADGERHFAFETYGDPWLGETLGLIALTEHTLLMRSTVGEETWEKE